MHPIACKGITTMKRKRDGALCHEVTASDAPQRIVEETDSTTKSGPKAVVLHSPYGSTRNAQYGWGDLFHPATPARVVGHEETIHIGLSSLNAVPGKASGRTMTSLLARYSRVFGCLEHCYPYHNTADAMTWRTWADMVRPSHEAQVKKDSQARVLPRRPYGTGSCAMDSPHAQKGEDKTSETTGTVSTVTRPDEGGEGATVRCFLAHPARFQYTIKANNYLTHVKQLFTEDADVVAHIHTFFTDLCSQLDPFLGPVLVQLPPSFQRSPANLSRLIALDAHLPKDEVEIEYPVVKEVVLAVTSPSERPHTRTTPQSQGCVRYYRRRRVRIAVEFRHRSWYHEDTFRTLRSLGWALVVAHHDDDPTFATPVDTGASFLYVRLHGALGRNVGDYGPSQMDMWAERILHFMHRGPDSSMETCGDGGAGGGNDVVVSPTRRQRVPCPREVFFFMNNSDSHVAGVTSSTVDARYLAKTLSARLASEEKQLEDSAIGTVTCSNPHTIESKETLDVDDEVVGSQPSVCVVDTDDGGDASVCVLPAVPPPEHGSSASEVIIDD